LERMPATGSTAQASEPIVTCLIASEPFGTCLIASEPFHTCLIASEPFGTCLIASEPFDTCLIASEPFDTCLIASELVGTCLIASAKRCYILPHQLPIVQIRDKTCFIARPPRHLPRGREDASQLPRLHPQRLQTRLAQAGWTRTSWCARPGAMLGVLAGGVSLTLACGRPANANPCFAGHVASGAHESEGGPVVESQREDPWLSKSEEGPVVEQVRGRTVVCAK
jgi:hypothetical protein